MKPRALASLTLAIAIWAVTYGAIGIGGCASASHRLLNGEAEKHESASGLRGVAGQAGPDVGLPHLPFNRALVDLSGRPAFVSRRGQGAFSNYVAVALPFPPALELRRAVESEFAESLLSRGEAHLTAITPPEFHDVLEARISIERLEEIAEREDLQRAQIESVCLGRSEGLVEGARHRTYFVVARSPDVLRFRRAVADEFLAGGGRSGAFKPDHFFPHVTIGFTKRDLHEEDGAWKDERACAAILK